MDEFKHTELENIDRNLNAKKFKSSLYYIVSDFNESIHNRNENAELIFFESANKPFMFYLVYLEVLLKILYNKNKLIYAFSIEKYLEINDFNSIPDCKKKLRHK